MAKKKVPQFANEDEERAFWSEHDSAEYLDWSQARRASAPNLRPQSLLQKLPGGARSRRARLTNKVDAR